MADNILLLYTEEEEKEKTCSIVKCNLAKQRAGRTGKFELKFNKVMNSFINIEEGAK